MKSLRVLNLSFGGLLAVPAFVGELESLGNLYLSDETALQIDAPLFFLIRGCPRLREVKLILPRMNSKSRAKPSQRSCANKPRPPKCSTE